MNDDESHKHIEIVLQENVRLNAEIRRLKQIIEWRDEEIKLSREINQHRQNIYQILNKAGL